MEIKELTADYVAEARDLVIAMAEHDGVKPTSHPGEFLENTINSTILKSFVGFEGDKIVSVSMGISYIQMLHLDFMVVHKDYRRKGLGEQMLDRWAEEAKGKILTLTTWNSDNAGLINYYMKRDFKVVGFVENEYGDGDREIHLTRQC